MKVRQNLHTHTVFDDGHDTHAEMAQAALDAGYTPLGLSYHSVLPIENDWCMQPEGVQPYFEALAAVREEYEGRLRIYSGIEWDGISDPAGREELDYVIGSLHHITLNGEHFGIEESYETLMKVFEEQFGRDPVLMSETFFAQYEQLADDPEVDIVGHLDIIGKYCEKGDILDLSAPYYIGSAVEAAGMLIKKDKIFELNSGAVFRGRKKDPYPAPVLLKELQARGARMTISADAHFKEQFGFYADESVELLKSTGFTEIWQLGESGFEPVKL